MRTLTLLVPLLSLVLVSVEGSARTPEARALAARVAELEAQVEALTTALAELQEVLEFVRVETGEIDGLAGPHWIIEGANVHVRSGSGRTDDGCTGFPLPDTLSCPTLSGLGNLVVGYNEPPLPLVDPSPSAARVAVFRWGSHNLVVGPGHSYVSFGGFVAGAENSLGGEHASISGGMRNATRGNGASIQGGSGNRASGPLASVSGGELNRASGPQSSVTGGFSNEASGFGSWVGGGRANAASGGASSVSGGELNRALGGVSSVSGGATNEARAGWSAVSGGRHNAAGPALLGGGRFSSVSGGANRTATGDYDWVAGSLLEPN